MLEMSKVEGVGDTIHHAYASRHLNPPQSPSSIRVKQITEHIPMSIVFCHRSIAQLLLNSYAFIYVATGLTAEVVAAAEVVVVVVLNCYSLSTKKIR